MRAIERIIGKKFLPGEIPTGQQICEKQLIKVIDDLEKVEVNEEEIANFMPEIYRKLEWLSKEDLIKRMVSHEFNRFSEYYHNREDIQQPTTESRGERGSRGEGRGNREGGSRKAAPGFTRLFINLGKMDNFFPNELIGLLNSNTRGRIELGRIDLMKNFSFFEVEEKEAKNVIKALSRANWNGRRVSVEVAGEESSSEKKGGYKRKEGGKESSSASSSSRKDKAGKSTKQADSKKQKSSREERGYSSARGKQDDWKQFFKGDAPDFSEEGWAKRKPKKK